MAKTANTLRSRLGWPIAATVAVTVVVLWLSLGVFLVAASSGVLGDAVGFELPAGVVGFMVLPAISAVGIVVNAALWARDRSARMLLVTLVPLVSAAVLLVGFISQWP
jgi:hypothetical protein